MKPHDATEQNTESGKGVAKQTDPLIPRSTGSKFTPQYWRDRIFRPLFTRDGAQHQVSEWYARIQFSGRREAVGLQTNNRDEAARRAAKLYQEVRGKGWEAALVAFRPKEAPRCLLTVGDWIGAVRPLLSVRQGTFDGYAFALRRIAAGVIGLSDDSKAKFHPKRKEWRAKVDAVQLAKLTPSAVKEWRRAFVDAGNSNPLLTARAKNSSNSYLRNARALFSPEVLAQLKGETLPAPLPFDGVKLEKKPNSRYFSTIDAAALLREARQELAESDPEAWKVVLLALGAGLRRGEIDALCRSQIDFEKGLLRVMTSEHFEAKTEDSIGEVFVDPELLAGLKPLLKEGSLFVIEPDTQARPNRKGQFYRCGATFARVTSWLRGKGVLTHKPLHTLRKEFGSIITANADIHTASRQLRHSNIGTTAAYYADSRRRAVVPIAVMLNEREAK